jgi:hypothetical protein
MQDRIRIRNGPFAGREAIRCASNSKHPYQPCDVAKDSAAVRIVAIASDESKPIQTKKKGHAIFGENESHVVGHNRRPPTALKDGSQNQRQLKSQTNRGAA